MSHEDVRQIVEQVLEAQKNGNGNGAKFRDIVRTFWPVMVYFGIMLFSIGGIWYQLTSFNEFVKQHTADHKVLEEKISANHTEIQVNKSRLVTLEKSVNDQKISNK